MKPRVIITPSFDGGRIMLRREYCHALACVGLAVWLAPLEAAVETEEYISQAHGLVLSGGGDIDPARYYQQPHGSLGEVDPERDELDFALASLALSRGLPVLAICRGLQVLNVATGGTLIQDIPKQRPMAIRHSQKAPRWHASHSIEIARGSLLQELYPGGFGRVNSFHHQAIDRLGKGLRVGAQSADGIVEAVEGEGQNFVLAVQWHPEDLFEYESEAKGLFHRFAEACIQYQSFGCENMEVGEGVSDSC